ncbi:MAG TPA: DUF1844 domain-containing protein [Tepidisphaeraceae bacterium]|nr:DUF1844 domain-containing protein [Tepidisphaeraceae bacterium]
MADNPSLQIDDDWKRQAQEEKRKLAEQERRQREASASTAAAPSSADADETSPRARREMPPANFSTLVQSFVTQALYYLGELAPQGGEPSVSLEMAKHHIDSLAVLEEKTKGNLSPEEKQMLDAALYETRMRFVSIAQQMIR